MERIIIIGCGGSGKSTLATRLGEKLSLPVYHLDRMFWRSGWNELPRDEWHTLHEELCARPEWILDGNYGGTREVRFAACDTIIFLDLPTVTCLFGAIQRFLWFRGRNRPDMADGCPERLEWEYLRWIWTDRRDCRPKILARLKELAATKQVVILLSRQAARQYLKSKPG
jgi:adenylate kinase family enzyme